MQWMFAILVFIVWRSVFNRSKTEESKPQWFYKELTEQEKQQCADQTESLLRKYPDALAGEVYPELVYKIYSERYSEGRITKIEFDALTDKILKKVESDQQKEKVGKVKN